MCSGGTCPSYAGSGSPAAERPANTTTIGLNVSTLRGTAVVISGNSAIVSVCYSLMMRMLCMHITMRSLYSMGNAEISTA